MSSIFEVADDGRGFDPSAVGYGTGLQGIADRLGALDGSLQVTSAPGAGARLVGRLPVGATSTDTVRPPPRPRQRARVRSAGGE